MQQVVDFELAVERISFVLAVVLFRDRLPVEFWSSLTIGQCFALMCNYPISRWRNDEDDTEEVTFSKGAYKKAQDRLLSIVDTSEAMDDLIQAHALSDQDVFWWIKESKIGRYEFHVRVLRKMIDAKPTVDQWKKIRRLASQAFRLTWCNRSEIDQEPKRTAKKDLEEIRAIAATKIFEAAQDAQDWDYLWTDEGTEHGKSLSGRCLFGLNAEQRVEVIRQMIIHLGELFDQNGGEQACIWALDTLAADAPEREIALDYLEKTWAFYRVGEYADPSSERYQRVIARLEQSNSFEGWLGAYSLTSSKNAFGTVCLERTIKLAKTRKQVEKVIRHLPRQDPRIVELKRRLDDMPPDPTSKRRGPKGSRRTSEVATS